MQIIEIHQIWLHKVWLTWRSTKLNLDWIYPKKTKFFVGIRPSSCLRNIGTDNLLFDLNLEKPLKSNRKSINQTSCAFLIIINQNFMIPSIFCWIFLQLQGWNRLIYILNFKIIYFRTKIPKSLFRFVFETGCLISGRANIKPKNVAQFISETFSRGSIANSQHETENFVGEMISFFMIFI